jgi:V-type H+-transporting ATPase subunit D
LPDINSELDELDREEFYRLKKVCRGRTLPKNHVLTPEQVANKKQRDTAAQDAEMKKMREALAAQGDENRAPEPEEDDEPKDMLAAEEDEDVIF